MARQDTIIKEYKKKLGSCSDMEQIVYSEAITLIENEVNPDKVIHWVNTTLFTFNNKPQPLSEKEKLKRKQKADRNTEKKVRFNRLNDELKSLNDKYGMITIGFFEPKEINYSEYSILIKTLKNKGLNVIDLGDGAYEPHITKEVLDQKAINKYKSIRFELNDFYVNKPSAMDSVFIDDVDDFRKKVMTLI